MPTIALPTVTSYVDQKWFLEPLTGDRHPRSYLNYLPEEVYNTSPDSHLARFFYALLGPSGVGFLRQNALEARMKLEEMGLELFDLEAFYGEPLSFTRITQELYDDDPRGLVDRAAWDKIRARDAQYRSRVLDFLDGVRAGNTPLGMEYVARSGLGHSVSIIENYRALFDERSDDPLGLVNYGKTRFTEEMIVLPRQEVAISEVQTVEITGNPTGGTFSLFFNGEETEGLGWNAPADNLRTFLEDVPSIMPGDIEVTGGPSVINYGNWIQNPRGVGALLPGWEIDVGGTGSAQTNSSVADVNFGTAAQSVVTDHGDQHGYYAKLEGDTFAVNYGDAILARISVKITDEPPGGFTAANLQIRTQGDAPMDETIVDTQVSPVEGQVYNLVGELSIGVGVDTAQIELRLDGAGPGEAYTVRISKAQLIHFPDGVVDDPGYFDGGSTDAYWTGAANASRSVYVKVVGGLAPYRVRFMGAWGARDVPEMSADASTLTGGTTPTIHIDTETEGVDAAEEVVYLPDIAKHHLQEAVDRLRPVTVIPTIGEAKGLTSRQLWNNAQATSEYDEVVRYVTGNAQIPWPPRDSVHWVEKGIEREAPKQIKDRQYQYMSYHAIAALHSFTDAAVLDPDYGTDETPSLMESNPSAFVGSFSEFQTRVHPFLAEVPATTYSADMVLSDQAEPLTIHNIVQDPTTNETITQLINGIYPQDYADLPGVPLIKYDYEQFWASVERSEGMEYIELDLGAVRGINHIQFEISNKPVAISIDFDLLDLDPERRYVPVNIDASRSDNLVRSFVPESLNPWTYNEFSFNNDNNELIYTRFVRLGFERINNFASPFVVSGTEADPQYHPWTIDVRNLRVGRNVTNM